MLREADLRQSRREAQPLTSFYTKGSPAGGLFLFKRRAWRVPIYCFVVNTLRAHTAEKVDARVKIVLLLVYSVSLFFVQAWPGMVLAAVAFLLAFLGCRVPAGRVFLVSAPVYLLIILMMASNSLVLTGTVGGEGLSSLLGDFRFSPEGFERSCLFASRVLLLVWMCLVVGFSMTTTEVSEAVRWFMLPLRRVGVNVEDASMVISIAVRFVPIMFEEFQRVRAAQWSRGGLSESGLIAQVKSWSAVLMPMLVGLFRRANTLGVAMDARCYGAASSRTSLNDEHVSVSSKVLLAGGLAFCLALALIF